MSHGATGGNLHFWWLPPLVPAPSYSGTFDGSQSPTVEICQHDGAGCVGAPIATYTLTGGPGGEVVSVSAVDELYLVNWHTDLFGLDVTKQYRISVSVAGTVLGFADVQPVESGKDLKKVDTNEYIALKDGRTLPVKFRIEVGALTATCSDGAQNGDETDVDCGGSCPPCVDGKSCQTAADCASQEDGLFCNGVEGCVNGTCSSTGVAVVCDDGVSCTTDTCNETAKRCDYTPGQCAAGEVCIPFSGCKLDVGSFGRRYESIIPPDATTSAYDPDRFSVVKGTVTTATGGALPGVMVAVQDAPELGSATTDASGAYSLPVNGGGNQIVTFAKSGYLEAERKVRTAWGTITTVDNVALVQPEAASTTITPDGNASTVFSHKNAALERPATVVIKGDNNAYSVDPAGVQTPLSSFTLRVTEYPTPDSMPAKLPPTSAFTYCAEFSVDGADSVKFDKPVAIFVKNSLGFSVGQRVPVGYYDRVKAAWVPQEDGVVVQLLDTDSDSVVDALDADGDGQKDDLNADGSYADEVAGLSDSATYVPGDTYWRVETTHFTRIDINWPRRENYSAAVSYDGPGPDVPKADDCRDQLSDETVGSAVNCQERNLTDDIALPLLPVSLHYDAKRTPGFYSKVVIPASGPTVPSALKAIIVSCEFAGKVQQQTLTPLPNQVTTCWWDHTDFLGNPVHGETVGTVSIGYQYEGVYTGFGWWSIAQPTSSFGATGTTSTGVAAREDVIRWSRYTVRRTAPMQKGGIGNGWTLDKHHHLDLSTETVHLGSGGTLTTPKEMIDTIPFSKGPQWRSESVVVGPDNSIYVGGTYAASPVPIGAIYRMKPDGTEEMIVGAGGGGYGGDGGPALQAAVSGVHSLTFGPDGSLYFISSAGVLYVDGTVVRRISPSGIITTVAGNNQAPNNDPKWGDGTPATQVPLFNVQDIAVANDGTLYIALPFFIKRVGTDGIISTIVGTKYYPPACSADGTLAVNADVSVTAIEVDDAGTLYVRGCPDAMRKITADGIFRVFDVAGWSGPGNGGSRMSIDPVEGYLYETYYHPGWRYMRRITPDGTQRLLTNVGVGTAGGDNGDGGPAADALIGFVKSSAVGPDGAVYWLDEYLPGIRKVSRAKFGVGATDNEVVVPASRDEAYVFSRGDGRHLRTVQLPTGKTLYSFGYDGNGNLTSMVDRFGAATTIVRDAAGTAQMIESPDGAQVSLNVNASGDLAGITFKDGSSYAFQYDAGSLLSLKTAPKGNVYRYYHDATGRTTRSEDSAGGSKEFSDPTNTFVFGAARSHTVMAQMTTALGKTKTYQHVTDAYGNTTFKVTDALGGVSEYTYDERGTKRTLADTSGKTTEIELGFDKRYQLVVPASVTTTYPSGLISTTTYTRAYDDTLSTITDTVMVNGEATTTVNDLANGTVTTTTPEGRSIVDTYSVVDLLPISREVAGGSTTIYTHDSRGRLKTVSEGTQTVNYTYDAVGNLTSIADAAGGTTTYTYDELGRPITHELPDGARFALGYDNNGYLSQLTYPTAAAHTFGRNGVDLMTSWGLPSGKSFTYTYNTDKERTQVLTPAGKTVATTMVNGLPTQVTTPDGTLLYAYLADSSGRLQSVNSPDGQTITYTYDGPLVTSAAYSGVASGTVSTTYDANARPSKVSVGALEIPFTYDKDGLLKSSKDVVIERGTSGSVNSFTDGAMTMTIDRDAQDRPTGRSYSLNGTAIYSVTWTRDASTGLIDSRTETAGTTTTSWAYTYNSRGFLTTVSKDGVEVESYAYDPMGNRTSQTNALLPTPVIDETATYNNMEQLVTRGSRTHDYDDDGYLTTVTDGASVTQYDYSALGQLKKVTLPDASTVEYQHDGLGRVVARKLNGAVTSKYLYLDFLRPLAELDSGSAVKRLFVYAGERVPFYMLEGSTKYYLLTDQIGTVRMVVKDDGTVMQNLEYDSWGNVVGSSSSTYEVPFGFAGGLSDWDAELIKFGFRMYSAPVGRWTSMDALAQQGGSNLYAYANNAPSSLVDPTGLILDPVTATVLSLEGIDFTVAALSVPGIPSFGTGVGALAGTIAGRVYSQAKRHIGSHDTPAPAPAWATSLWSPHPSQTPLQPSYCPLNPRTMTIGEGSLPDENKGLTPSTESVPVLLPVPIVGPSPSQPPLLPFP